MDLEPCTGMVGGSLRLAASAGIRLAGWPRFQLHPLLARCSGDELRTLCLSPPPPPPPSRTLRLHPSRDSSLGRRTGISAPTTIKSPIYSMVSWTFRARVATPSGSSTHEEEGRPTEDRKAGRISEEEDRADGGGGRRFLGKKG